MMRMYDEICVRDLQVKLTKKIGKVVFDTIDNDSPDYWDVIGAILSVLGSVIGEIPPENHADIGAKLVEHIPEVMQTVSAMHENDGVVQ